MRIQPPAPVVVGLAALTLLVLSASLAAAQERPNAYIPRSLGNSYVPQTQIDSYVPETYRNSYVPDSQSNSFVPGSQIAAPASQPSARSALSASSTLNALGAGSGQGNPTGVSGNPYTASPLNRPPTSQASVPSVVPSQAYQRPSHLAQVNPYVPNLPDSDRQQGNSARPNNSTLDFVPPPAAVTDELPWLYPQQPQKPILSPLVPRMLQK